MIPCTGTICPESLVLAKFGKNRNEADSSASWVIISMEQGKHVSRQPIQVKKQISFLFISKARNFIDFLGLLISSSLVLGLAFEMRL